jgi:hypothetical protein
VFKLYNDSITNEQIQELVTHFVVELPVSNNNSVQQNWEDLGEYLRFLTPICFGNIEGNHRLEYWSRVGQGYEISATVPLQRKTSFIVPPSTSTVYKKLSAKLWISQRHPISKDFVEQVAKRSEELQINKELSIRNTIHTVLDEIANVIYKRTKAKSKSGSSTDISKLVTLQKIHRELCDIIVDVIFQMEPTKHEFCCVGLSQEKFVKSITTKNQVGLGSQAFPSKSKGHFLYRTLQIL